MDRSKLPTPAQLNNNSKDTKLEAIRGAVRQNERLARRVSPRTSMVNNNNANLVLGEGDAFDETGTNPFTGVAIVHPGHTDDNGTWNIFGKNEGTLQFGLSATDGKAYAGAGAVVLDEDGISILNGSNNVNKIKFETSGTTYSEIYSAVSGGEPTLNITNPKRDANNNITINPDANATYQSVLTLRASSGSVSNTINMYADSDGSNYTAINDNGDDIDTRIESDGNENAIFVDAGNNRVGIMNGSPAVALDVTGAVTASSNITSNAFFNMGATNAQTINAGVITVTGGRCVVDTQGGAATDDLDTINGGTDGDLLVIYTANSGRDVTAKDGTGNLALAGDFVMTNIRDRLVLLKDSGTWVELSRSDNQ